jgi:hypothetical protein
MTSPYATQQANSTHSLAATVVEICLGKRDCEIPTPETTSMLTSFRI